MDPRPASIVVFGASGYTGGELLRLLTGPPRARVIAAVAGAMAGRPITERHPHLHGYAGAAFAGPDPAVTAAADVALLALPHDESAALAPGLCEQGIRVIDLSGAFRLDAGAYPRWYGFEHPAPAWLDKAVYGLPELFADQIAEAQLVANPGCYPTASILALHPLLRAGMVEANGIVIDAKSGISGAGRTPTDATHFVTTDGSVRPYGAGGSHRHVPELQRFLEAGVTFVPHLVPASRGLLATCYARARTPVTTDAVLDALAGAYEGSPFVRVLPAGSMPDTKHVTGSNTALLGAAVDAGTGLVTVACALDNLVKGAAGQAVQNLNLMLGYPETAGLDAPAVYP